MTTRLTTAQRVLADCALDSTEAIGFDRPDGIKATDLLPLLAWIEPTPANQRTLISRIAISAARAAMRDEPCTRLPRIVGLVATPTHDEFGNNLFVEVEYAAGKAWRAVWGGRFEGEHAFAWTIYAD